MERHSKRDGRTTSSPEGNLPVAALGTELPVAVWHGEQSAARAGAVPDRLSNGIKSARLVGMGAWILTGSKLLVSGAQLTVAILQEAAASVWDSLHGGMDFPAYRQQLQLISMLDPESQGAVSAKSRFASWSRIKRRLVQGHTKDQSKLERASYAWISLPALGAAGLAGVAFTRELMGHGDDGKIDLMDVAHVGASGAALAVTAGLIRVGGNMKRKVKAMPDSSPDLKRRVQDFYTHAKLDGASSGAAMVEALAHMTNYGVAAINVGVMALAGYQAWRFWPSRAGKKAVSHNHAHEHAAEHGRHDHQHCDHVHLVPHEVIDAGAKLLHGPKLLGGLAVRKTLEASGQLSSIIEKGQSWFRVHQKARQIKHTFAVERPWWQWVERQVASEAGQNSSPNFWSNMLNDDAYQTWKQQQEALYGQSLRRARSRKQVGTMLTAGIAAMAFGGGLAGDTVQGEAERKLVVPSAGAAIQLEPLLTLSGIGPAPASVPRPFTECVKVEKGDSQWHIVAQRAKEATARKADITLTNILATITAYENRNTNPNPGVIRPGQCLQVPTRPTIAAIEGVLSHPTAANTALAADLRRLNAQPTLQAALRQAEAFDHIQQKLSKVAG